MADKIYILFLFFLSEQRIKIYKVWMIECLSNILDISNAYENREHEESEWIVNHGIIEQKKNILEMKSEIY